MKSLLMFLLCVFASVAHPAGTVVESKQITLQRSGVPLTLTSTYKLACPAPITIPTTEAECLTCKAFMIEAEKKIRTTGKITYECLDRSKSVVTFTKGTTTPPVTPPAAALQVYTCPEAGADGRVLENNVPPAIIWPNCATATYQNPSRSLVVATNDDGKLFWLRGDKALEGVWVRRMVDGIWIEGPWTRHDQINWTGTTTPLPPTPGLPTGGTGVITVSWSWKSPPEYTDGKPLTVAKYAIYFGNTIGDLGDRNTKAPIEVPGNVFSYQFKNVPDGAWYFAISSIDSAGKEGFVSHFVSKKLP